MSVSFIVAAIVVLTGALAFGYKAIRSKQVAADVAAVAAKVAAVKAAGAGAAVADAAKKVA